MPDFSFEKKLITSGHEIIAGVDEAGRGLWPDLLWRLLLYYQEIFESVELDDSKKLSSARREKIYNNITSPHSNVIYAYSVVDEEQIDTINILRATHKAMAQAVLNLSIKPSFVIIDGMPVKDFPLPNDSIVKGDSKSLSIAAASIIAKVERDKLMLKYSKLYPDYKFEKHKGYGTKVHLEALDKFGPCKIHRKVLLL